MVSNFDKILFIILKSCTFISLSLSLTHIHDTNRERERGDRDWSLVA